MTHSRDNVQRITELKAAFTLLNDSGQDSALTILRALNFAQSVMSAEACEAEATVSRRQAAKSG